MKKVFISLLTYNGHDQTIQCLRSLEKVKMNDIELHVMVIDNASKEKFYYPYSPKHYGLMLIHQPQNLGFAGGHNVGIKHALEKGADYVLILNNDTIVDPSFLEILVAKMEEDEKIGATVPKIYFRKGHEYYTDKYAEKDLGKVFWYAGGYMDWANIIGHHRGVDEVDKGQYDKTEQTELLTGCCVLLRTEALKKVKGFDDRYFLYYEDADLNERLKQEGYSIWYVPDSVIWHNNAGSTGGSGSVLQDYYISRNRMLFGMTHAPLRTKVALVRESIRLLRNGREWQKKGVADFYLRKFGKGSFAV